jgi:hypothetical protein
MCGNAGFIPELQLVFAPVVSGSSEISVNFQERSGIEQGKNAVILCVDDEDIPLLLRKLAPERGVTKFTLRRRGCRR